MAEEGRTLEGVRGFETMPLRDDNPSRIDLLGFDDILASQPQGPLAE